MATQNRVGQRLAWNEDSGKLVKINSALWFSATQTANHSNRRFQRQSVSVIHAVNLEKCRSILRIVSVKWQAANHPIRRFQRQSVSVIHAINLEN